MSDPRPIGVFDSGVGGLTVLRALHAHLPQESTVYLGDLARCPYGVRPQEEIRRFSLQIGDVLAAEHIKMLVVACNTATAAALRHLEARLPLPVIGVVQPGARAALLATRNGRIGVVATNATIATGAYRKALHSLRPEVDVVEQAASWLVPLVERGWLARQEVAERIEPLIDDLAAHDIDTLILGCTHFPLVRDLFEATVPPDVTIVDSAVTTAHEVAAVLHASDLGALGPPSHRLLVTGPAEAFAERTQAMFRASPAIESIDLAVDPVL